MTEETTVVETEEQAAPARDFETEARAQGWVPEAEFKGDKKPAQFLDAESFVKRGEEIAPFVKKENQRLKDELARKDADYAKRFERLEKTSTTAFEALKRTHESELAKVKSEQRAAVAAGDDKEFDRLEKVRDGLEKSAPKLEEPAKATPEQTFEQERDAWVKENDWFTKDFDLQDWAIRYSDFHGRQNPQLSFRENMAAVAEEAKRRFPDKFGGKKPSGHSAVDGGSDFAGVFKSNGKSEADLPAEARAAGERFVKQGLYKDMKAYAKEYFNA